MKILITNAALQVPGGTETVVVQLCRKLMQRGHQVAAFSTRLGHVAELLASETVPVISHFRALPFQPDIIHGQHHAETMAALLALPGTPAIYYAHGVLPWQERVPVHPRILRYLTLTEQGVFRLMAEKNIPPGRCHVLNNLLDLDRFPAAKPAPERLRTAAYCPRGRPGDWVLKSLRAVCRERGIEFHHEESWAGSGVADPHAVYARHDLVFGTGRTAIEALAAGCAVSATDHEMLGELITAHNVARRAGLNMARTRWEDGISPETLAAQLAAYHVAHQQSAVEYIRATADLDRRAVELEGIYAGVIEEWNMAPRPSVAEDMGAAGDYLRALIPFLDEIQQDRMSSVLVENAGLHALLREKQEQLKDREIDVENHLKSREVEAEARLKSLAAEAENTSQRLQLVIRLWEDFAGSTLLRRLLTRRVRHAIKRIVRQPGGE